MSAQINDGGPAFPTIYPALDPRASGFQTEQGLTLRDWFAGQAIASMSFSTMQKSSIKEIANHAYALADAMLSARKEAAK